MPSLLSRIDFGNEASDDVDPKVLSSYFVVQPNFARALDPANKILVATAKKGVGKSALIQWAAHLLKQEHPNDIVIRCRGADLVRSRFGLQHDLRGPNDHIHDWMVRICALVNRELALRIGLALTDDKIVLVETAELTGYKSRNLVGCLLDRFKRVLGKAAPDKLAARDEVALLRRVKHRKLWLLIDDLDATFQNTRDELLQLSTFFSACRYLTQDMTDVFFRATMRTDVWPLIRRFDEALDKMEQYVTDIVWRRDDFRRILHARIKPQLDRLNARHQGSVQGLSEEGEEPDVLSTVLVDTMEWGEKQVPTSQVIYTLSYQRPRWGIQLCKLAQKSALRYGAQRIDKTHIDDVWGEYGTKRIADLVSEHKHQCQDVEELLYAFRGCDRLMSRDKLFSWINRRITPHMASVIEGKATRSPREVARFLYRIGFILARSDNEVGYEHYHFGQMPDFLSSRTDEDFGVAWEIHPCYREALDIKKVDRSHRARFGKLRGKRERGEHQP